MKRPLFYKLLTIAALILLILIPLSMIRGVIDERKNTQESIVKEIQKTGISSQRLIGPVIVVPYKQKITEWKIESATGQRQAIQSTREGQLYFLPSAFQVDGKLQAEKRSRGIYEVRVYHADNSLSGHFDIPENYGITDDFESYQFDTPYIAMGIKDTRGIQNQIKLNLGAALIDMQPGAKLKHIGEGVHAELKGWQLLTTPRIDFSLSLSLQGMQDFSVVPIGKDSSVSLSANWPHPSFGGSILPKTRQVTDSGFNATWQSSIFSTNIEEIFFNCVMDQHNCESLQENAFEVSLIDPVNHYVKSDRAMKYGILFVALTFTGFFLFELLKKARVHYVQYTLVGLALSVFFLLLIALSEHLGFLIAYCTAAVACILLLGIYVSYMLQGKSRGLVFSGLLSALYAMLYSLLNAEDYALLLGALLLFVILGAFMMLTRHIDWYMVGKNQEMFELEKE